jgi:hypothetical protein
MLTDRLSLNLPIIVEGGRTWQEKNEPSLSPDT